MIKDNVRSFLSAMPKKNGYGEDITLLAAVKTQTPAAINEAIEAGVKVIGDNHAQEFRDKFDQINKDAQRHFIGRLQTNKIKYLLGRVDLYQSIDSLHIAQTLSDKSTSFGIVSNILLEINGGDEKSKGGFALKDAEKAFKDISSLPGVKICGLMAMFPATDDEKLIFRLASDVRKTYDELKAEDENITTLSMGMSGDWKVCVDAGSNMIRIGTALFGKRS